MSARRRVRNSPARSAVRSISSRSRLTKAIEPPGEALRGFFVGPAADATIPRMNKALLLSILYFLLAGLMEIGGYLIWLWLRERRSIWLAVVGAAVLVGYGVVPTLQPSHFGRVYAAYGGVFVVMSVLWGWGIDGHRPDRWDVFGSALCLAGVGLMMYMPRPSGG